MWKILDANCSAPARVDAPRMVHGLWYSYCAKCATYHAVISDAESSQDLATPARKKVLVEQQPARGMCKVIALRPRARAAARLLHLHPRNENSVRPLFKD